MNSEDYKATTDQREALETLLGKKPVNNCAECPARQFAKLMANKIPLLHGEKQAQAERLYRQIMERTDESV